MVSIENQWHLRTIKCCANICCYQNRTVNLEKGILIEIGFYNKNLVIFGLKSCKWEKLMKQIFQTISVGSMQKISKSFVA